MNEQQLQDIKSLQEICEQQDDIRLKLNDDMLRMDSRADDMDYFYCEDDRLVGFLALYGFGGQIEVCGMVHPEYRRQGIFTRLWNAALASGRLAAVPHILFNAPKASLSAPEWLKTIRCRYSFSEYEMAWQADRMQQSSASFPTPSVSYRPYEEADRNFVLQLYSEGFDTSEEDTAEMLQEEEYSAKRIRSMVVYHGESVGTLVMNYDTPGQAWIYAFVISSSYRGQGIGRSILTQMIRRENEAGLHPHIGVETQNDHALRLYENCGFRSYAVQDYYELRL